MLNPNPLRCSTYHEPGHGVVGISGGIELKLTALRPKDGSDPQCRWDGYACRRAAALDNAFDHVQNESKIHNVGGMPRRAWTKCGAQPSLTFSQEILSTTIVDGPPLGRAGHSSGESERSLARP